MSRARQRKQEEKITFLQENPELIEHEATFGVEGPDQFGRFGPTATYQGNPYYADGWVEGEIPGDLTLYGFIFGGGAELNAYLNGPGGEAIHLGGGPYISTSALGFGVADPGEAEGIGFGGAGSRSSLVDGPVDGAKTLDADEVLVLDIFTPKKPMQYTLEEGPEMDLGATGVNVEFLVVSGSGAVELYTDEGGAPAQTKQVGPGQAGLEDQIALFEGPDNPFDDVGIIVTGDLEIAVTGISYSLNFEPMLESM